MSSAMDLDLLGKKLCLDSYLVNSDSEDKLRESNHK